MSEISQNTADILERVPIEKLEGKTVLLTGGSGLLGLQILEVLAHANLAKLSVQLLRGFANAGFHPEILENGDFIDFYYVDLANADDCARLPNADVVISAASYAQPLRFLADPLHALRAASFGLLTLLERVNVGGRFLYISSSEVYCDSPFPPPFNEDQTGACSPYHPRACYIGGKLFGEAMVYLYRNRGISTVAVRPGIIYGPGFKPGDQRSWASFVERAVKLNKIEMLDAGLAQRTFCYMTDGIELIFRALLDGSQPVYNIAGRDTCSIGDLARKIGEIAGVPVIVPDVDHGVAGTPETLALDVSRALGEFGKEKFLSLDEGLERTIRWFEEVYG